MKIKKGLIVLSLLSAFMMAGCEGALPEGASVEETSQGEKTSRESVEPFVNDPLPFNEQEIANNILNLGIKTGFELVCEARDVNAEAAEEFTVGVKGYTAWGIYKNYAGGVVLNTDGSATGYYKEDINQEYYKVNQINADTLKDSTPQQYFEQYAGSISSSIYYANTSAETLNYKRGEEKEFLGRQVVEYNFYRRGAKEVGFKAYIDLELGITLYWSGELTDGVNTVGGTFEVKSFKVGDDVEVPEFPVDPNLLA